MFPGAGAQVYFNEEGEPLGWDYPEYDSLDRHDDLSEDYGRDDWEDEAD